MKRHALIDGIIVKRIVEQDDQPDVFTDNGKFWKECPNYVGPNWIYQNGIFVSPDPIPSSLPNIITKIAFRFRFTDTEYAGILAATKTDVEVQAWYETFNMVTTVDLDNQRTKDGVANLVSKNLLTPARANEILTAPVQNQERA